MIVVGRPGRHRVTGLLGKGQCRALTRHWERNEGKTRDGWRIRIAHPSRWVCTTRSISSGRQRWERVASAGTCPPPAARNSWPGYWTGKRSRRIYRRSVGEEKNKQQKPRVSDESVDWFICNGRYGDSLWPRHQGIMSALWVFGKPRMRWMGSDEASQHGAWPLLKGTWWGSYTV